MDVPDLDATLAALQTTAAADVMNDDGLLAETLVLLVETTRWQPLRMARGAGPAPDAAGHPSPVQPVPVRPNVMLYVYGMDVSPEVIYIIRHAEKPLKPPLSGVDFEGGQNEHSLLPRGWQRSGALAALFHPDFGPVRAGLRTPTMLVAPSWGHPGKTAAHRSYQTIQGLSERLGLPITSQFAQGREQQLADSLVRSCSGVVLICWEHSHIPVIASSLPVVSGTAIPRKWPGHRYDVIWSFTLVPGPGPVRYVFGQIPQLLLAGDAGTVIPAGVDEPENGAGHREHHRG